MRVVDVLVGSVMHMAWRFISQLGMYMHLRVVHRTCGVRITLYRTSLEISMKRF